MKTNQNTHGTLSRLAIVAAFAVTGIAYAHAGAADNVGAQLEIHFTGESSIERASKKGPPDDCVPDVKLIGCFAVSTADEPGTWWRLTKDRFDALGVTDYKAALESFYDIDFDTLEEAIEYLIEGVAAWDKNGNGIVCAYEMRGTRAYLGENALFLLGIDDDKFADR